MKPLGAIFILWVIAFTSCKFNPTEMANDYCNCHKRFEQGKGKAEECRELAESHFLKLQDDDEAMNKYTQFIAECLTYDDIRTNEDLRQDRKQRRSRKK